MRPPVRWFGGKTMMSHILVALLPKHHTYVEPFGGGGSVLFAKSPSPVEIYNDLDSGLVNLYRVLRDPEKMLVLQRKCSLTPYSREVFNTYRYSWKEQKDPIERAYQFLTVARMSFSGEFGNSWSFSITESRRGMAQNVSKYLGVIDRLPELCQRLAGVQVECSDFREVLSRYDTPETLFYVDPPYHPETRRSGGYAHELSHRDHEDLVERLLRLAGGGGNFVMLRSSRLSATGTGRMEENGT